MATLPEPDRRPAAAHGTTGAPDSHVTVPPAIIARAQAGDAEAFELLYRATAGRVYALCLRLTADRVEAADLMQDTFVRVWKQLPAFRGESALGTWIHRIAVTGLLERRRSATRREARIETRGDLEVIGGRARPEPLDSRLDLETAMARLGETARRVFVLHDMEGYDYAEIHELTGLSEVALRSQLHRARRKLMTVLEP
ncbi:MAG: RNA polymerase sigma factor [Gemmatimonadaceae bacterium]|nr:RNA polymerase sigma factor [Gemmatimonadaceae bacterium]